jgi:hypothetical protein
VGITTAIVLPGHRFLTGHASLGPGRGSSERAEPCPGRDSMCRVAPATLARDQSSQTTRAPPLYRSRFTEDGMSADAAPNHVWLPRVPLGTILPGSTPVRRPRHFSPINVLCTRLTHNPGRNPRAARRSAMKCSTTSKNCFCSAFKFDAVPVEPGLFLVGRHRA